MIKRNNYVIYGEEYIEGGALDQFYEAMKLDCVVRGALMPDAHLGYTLPIGAVVSTDGMIFPSWVGYDIGCGVCAVRISYHPDVIKERAGEIFEEIYHHVPVGFKHQKRPVSWRDYARYDKTSWFDKMFYDKGGLKQLGTLGGGNHFIEIGTGENDQVWIIVHSGSRNVGHSTATHYMREASYLHTGKRKAREAHYGFEVQSDFGLDYIKDLSVCTEFALANRQEIVRGVERALRSINMEGEVDWDSLINRNHNHIEFRDDLIIHRKGATHADKDMLGVIPGNMRDGSFIIRGLGNADSLYSSSHGAGRVLSRKKAKETLDRDVFAEEMIGIIANVGQGTLDESPMAYKDIFTVMDMQRDLVEIVEHIKPIINVKG